MLPGENNTLMDYRGVFTWTRPHKHTYPDNFTGKPSPRITTIPWTITSRTLITFVLTYKEHREFSRPPLPSPNVMPVSTFLSLSCLTHTHTHHTHTHTHTQRTHTHIFSPSLSPFLSLSLTHAHTH